MKKNILRAYLLAFCLLCGTELVAQITMPRLSPSGSITQQVGFNKITIDYSSPAVKGRKVFGELQKWGVSWRAGANEATKITFTTPVIINEKELNAGTYTLFLTPNQTQDWVFHLNAKKKSIFAYMKDNNIDEEALAKDDAVSIEVKAEKAPFAERLAYYISPNDNKKATITLHWADIKVSFDVDVRTESLAKRITEAVK